MNVTALSALEMAALIRKRELLPSEITRAVYDKIDAKDGRYNSFITLSRDMAFESAQLADSRAEKGELLSVLDGIPVAVKDNICTISVKTTCASKMLKDYIPPYDAAAVSHLKNAGAVIVGKTNLDEFAMGATGTSSYFGAVHNPYDVNRTAGGSSSGSAAAVAARFVPLALGSDTGGSVRQPAAMCGVCGMKPTYGAVSRYGLVAYSSSFDQIGVLSQNAADNAALLDVISAADRHDSTYLGVTESFSSMLSMSLSGKKIGIPKECLDGNIDAEVAAAFLQAVDVMTSLGCQIEVFPFPIIKFVVPCYYIISNAEASTNLSRFDGVKYGHRTDSFTDIVEMIALSRSEGFGREVKKRIMLGTFALTAENYEKYYKKANKTKALLTSWFDGLYKQYDMIMCPTVPSAAGPLDSPEEDENRHYLSDIYTVSANIAGLPAISVPCGFTKDGLPIGMQFMGRRFDDAAVLGFASAYQSATEWQTVTPNGGGPNV